MAIINTILTRILLALIYLYQILIRPILAAHCRFYPSCSCYFQIALARYGIYRGSTLTFKRLMRCHPWHEGGYDPVPSWHEGK
jgi:uncharacterized protein